MMNGVSDAIAGARRRERMASRGGSQTDGAMERLGIGSGIGLPMGHKVSWSG